MDPDKTPMEESEVETGYEFRAPSKKVILGLMVALVLYVIVRGLAVAITKPLWFDELQTLAVASQSSVRAIWNALYQGADSPPPVFELIERIVLHIVHSKQIAVRLPAILATPCTLVCVFAYVRKKNSEPAAFVCALLILLTSVFLTHGAEGRPYGTLVACIAFALVCYQRVPSLFWTIMLGVSLILAQSLHYYALFSMLPFWVAESVYVLTARRFRWQVWAALALGPVPLLFFWPLLASLRAIYGAHIWNPLGLSSIPVMYGNFFFTGGAFGFAVFAVGVAGIVGARLLPAQGSSGQGVDHDPVEAALLLTLLALPFPTAFATRLMHGSMSDRYVLATMLGVALAMA